MTETELYEFLGDPLLTELQERARIADDVLDIISLSENQHSSVLAWCLTPGEGHGQGDAVLKDLLLAIYRESERPVYDNKKFVTKWTPGRIRTTSFGSAFVTREFSILIEKEEGQRQGRIDLFIIDPRNEFVVVIENKAGAALDRKQLDGYNAAVKERLRSRVALKDFDFAFVVLDKELGEYNEDHLSNLGNRWVLLDYSWLNSSAKRCQLQFDRGNPSVQLLLSYCQQQTGYESENESKLSRVTFELANKHAAVLQKLRDTWRFSIESWVPSSLTGHDGELLLFRSQYRRLCELLLRSEGIAAVRKQLKSKLQLDEEQFDGGRAWFCLAPPQVKSLAADEEWPCRIAVWRSAVRGLDAPVRYSVHFVWVKSEFGDEDIEENLRARFVHHYPGLSHLKEDRRRRLVLERDLNGPEAVKIAETHFRRISELLSN